MKMLVSRMRENQKKGRNFKGMPVEPQLRQARAHLAKSYGLEEDEVSKIGNAESRRHSHDINANVPVGHLEKGQKSREAVALAAGESQTQIQRYIRLTELIPELLQLEDEEVTKRLLNCSELLGIKMMDHIIVAGETGAMYSFKSEGMLDQLRPERHSWER